MDRMNEAFAGMNFKVKNFSTINSAAIATITGLAPLFAQHTTLLDSFLQTDRGSRMDNTGATIDKTNKRKTLETMGLKVSNALTSYYVINPNPLLQKRADYSTSTWYSTSEEALVTMASTVKELATPVAASLGGFGATNADVTALGTALTAFLAVIANPTTYTDIKKEDNKKLELIAEEIRTLFSTKIDVLMRSFEVGNASLYRLYQSARAIDINGSSATPTAERTLLPATTSTVHTALAYNEDTFYTVQNIGTEEVYFSLSTTENTEGPEPILLAQGETRSRLASNLAPSGTFLVFNNPSASGVKIKVWVE